MNFGKVVIFVFWEQAPGEPRLLPTSITPEVGSGFGAMISGNWMGSLKRGIPPEFPS